MQPTDDGVLKMLERADDNAEKEKTINACKTWTNPLKIANYHSFLCGNRDLHGLVGSFSPPKEESVESLSGLSGWRTASEGSSRASGKMAIGVLFELSSVLRALES
jgi:hypothetical protein